MEGLKLQLTNKSKLNCVCKMLSGDTSIDARIGKEASYYTIGAYMSDLNSSIAQHILT